MPEGMDFHLVTSTLLRDFEEKGVRYAVIGGFAMGLWGASRATVDMDFLLLLDDLAQAESVLADLSYRRVYKSENVAQYVSDLAPYGQVDVVLAFRAISRAMLERSVRRELEQGQTVRTLIPEDLAGLKLQAMVNDPSRGTQERADIEVLLAAKLRQGQEVDWELLGDYFSLFGRSEELEELKRENGWLG